jgi:dynein heavy chain
MSLFLEAYDKVKVLQEQIKKAEITKSEINEREILVGWDETEFKKLDVLVEEIIDFDKLWTSVKEFKEKHDSTNGWVKGPLANLVPAQIELDVRKYFGTCVSSYQALNERNYTQPAKAAQQIQTEIEAFKKQIPLIHAICEEGIRDRHWDEISKTMNVPIRYQDPALNLK